MGSCRNRTVSGCLPRNSGTASAALGPPAARRNSRNSAPVRVGKEGVECATMSVCRLFPPLSGRWKRIARPRGLALPSVSGMLGRPVDEEKRSVMGVEGVVKCGALERVEAVGVGMKVPVRRWPFAWAEARQNKLLRVSSH